MALKHSSPLSNWQDRLETHFSKLAAARRDWPVFGLEHGLNSDEIAALETAIRADGGQRLQPANYLPWIAYASEFGYRFAGSEYWQSFESNTPGNWNYYGRDLIRNAFKRFAREYQGAIPEGTWADAFTIISWPVTHGVLPRDLQRELARLLYDVRFTFDKDVFKTARSLGLHLRARSHSYKSRFRQFAENYLLLGQIAGALLLHESQEDLLEPATLGRIVRDLTREQAASEWLNDARRATNRLQLKGLSSRLGDTSDKPDRISGEAESNSSSVKIAERLVLRRRSAKEWDALLELPDLDALLQGLPAYRDEVLNARFTVPHAMSKTLARGRLIGNGSQQVSLKSWPSSREPLLRLETGSPELRFIIESSFLFPETDFNLFRKSENGLAYLQLNRIVRPGDSYLILTRNAINNPPSGLVKVEISCSGVHAFEFSLPEKVSEEWQGILSACDVEARKTLNVWPAGRSPVDWSGDGQACWSTEDEVVLGVDVDHDVRAVEIQVDDGLWQSFDVDASASRVTCFLSLGRVAAGHHRVLLLTRAQNLSDDIKGQLVFQVRPNTTLPRSTRQPLLLSTHPMSPALEDVWENRMQLQLQGPEGFAVNCQVRLRHPKHKDDLYRRPLPKLQLPVSPIEWEKVFDKQIRKDKKAESAIDAAQEMCIEFDAGILGVLTLNAEREFTPLRWIMTGPLEKPILRLINDRGALNLNTYHRSPALPAESDKLDLQTVESGLGIEFPGGLYCVSGETPGAAVVCVPTAKTSSFAMLQLTPAVKDPARDPETLCRYLQTALEWRSARLKGSSLAEVYRDRAASAILTEVWGAIGGLKWLRAERALNSEPSNESWLALKHAVTDHGDEKIIAAVIEQRLKENRTREIGISADELSEMLNQYARSFKGNGAKITAALPTVRDRQDFSYLTSICEFALHVAAAFNGLVSSYSLVAVREGIQELLTKPIALRAARFAVVTAKMQALGSLIDRANYNG